MRLAREAWRYLARRLDRVVDARRIAEIVLLEDIAGRHVLRNRKRRRKRVGGGYGGNKR
jgi:hypothetical protein